MYRKFEHLFPNDRGKYWLYSRIFLQKWIDKAGVAWYDKWRSRKTRSSWLVWGIGSVGRASRSQCEGQGFDSPILHHRKDNPNPLIPMECGLGFVLYFKDLEWEKERALGRCGLMPVFGVCVYFRSVLTAACFSFSALHTSNVAFPSLLS